MLRACLRTIPVLATLALAACGSGDACGDCDDGDPCTLDRCDGKCEHVAISECADGDGCCPADCTPEQDADCSEQVDCGFDPELSYSFRGEIQQLLSEDGRDCVWLHRRDDCPEGWICMAVPYTVLAARIGHDGRVVSIEDSEKFIWQSTHHNWEDVMLAFGEEQLYRLEVHASNEITYLLSGMTLDGQELLWGPETLLPNNR